MTIPVWTSVFVEYVIALFLVAYPKSQKDICKENTQLIHLVGFPFKDWEGRLCMVSGVNVVYTRLWKGWNCFDRCDLGPDNPMFFVPPNVHTCDEAHFATHWDMSSSKGINVVCKLMRHKLPYVSRFRYRCLPGSLRQHVPCSRKVDQKWLESGKVLHEPIGL